MEPIRIFKITQEYDKLILPTLKILPPLLIVKATFEQLNLFMQQMETIYKNIKAETID